MKATKKFETVKDLINDDKFLKFISVRLIEIEDNRKKILRESGKGASLKKGPYDYLSEKKLLNPESIKVEFIQISMKTSSLPSIVREYIDNLCLVAIQKTIAYYDAIDKKKAIKKPSKPRTRKPKQTIQS